MSRISPFHFDINEYDPDELENICPRYLKWMKKVTALDFSKKKRVKKERVVPSFEYRYNLGDSINSRQPNKRPKTFLSKIRKGGQNLRVRVQTSADLWRRWIRGGIMYNTELNEQDEQEFENQENERKAAKADSQPKPSDVKESKVLEKRETQIIIKVTETEVTEKIDEKPTEVTEEKQMEEKTIEKSDQNKTEEKSETQPQIEKNESNVTEINDNSEDTSKEITESNINENTVIVISNSTLSVNKSSDGKVSGMVMMPEVVANND